MSSMLKSNGSLHSLERIFRSEVSIIEHKKTNIRPYVKFETDLISEIKNKKLTSEAISVPKFTKTI